MKIEAIVKDTHDNEYKDALITITEDIDALSPFYMMRADDEVKDEYVQLTVNSRNDLCDFMQGKRCYNNQYFVTELGSCLSRKGMGVKYPLLERAEEYDGIKFKTDPAGHKIARMRVTGGPGAATELLINLGPSDITMFTENAPLYSVHTSIKPAIYILPFGLYIGKPPCLRGVTLRDTKWNDSKWKIEIPANASLRGVIKFIEDNYGWFEALVDAVLGGVDITKVEDPEMKKYLKALNAWAMDGEELPILKAVSADEFLNSVITLDHIIPDFCLDSCMDCVEDSVRGSIPDNVVVYGVRDYLDGMIAEYKERLRKGDKHE